LSLGSQRWRTKWHHIFLSSPVQVGSDTDWESLVCGLDHVLARKNTGSLWVWGNNNFGQLGNSSIFECHRPTLLNSSLEWILFSGGDGYSIGVKSDNCLWSWGKNDDGQLALPHTGLPEISYPIQIGALIDWS